MDNLTRQYQYNHPSPNELLDIFPDAVPAIRKNLKDLKTEYKKAENLGEQFVDLVLDVTARNFSDEYFRRYWEEIWLQYFYYTPLKQMKKRIKLMENYVKLNDWKKIPPEERKNIGPQNIAKAKEFPLENLININGAGFARCPFHSEKTASFKIHKDNRYHCYGCGADGDVIDFCQKQYNLTFLEAVKRLI